MSEWYEPEFEHYEGERERLDRHRAAIGITAAEAAKAYAAGYKSDPQPESLTYRYWLRGRHDRLMGRPISTGVRNAEHHKSV